MLSMSSAEEAYAEARSRIGIKPSAFQLVTGEADVCREAGHALNGRRIAVGRSQMGAVTCLHKVAP